MKKVIDVSVGGVNFIMEEDAYNRLQGYLQRFENTITDKNEAKEIMEDVEARVAEIFQKERKYANQVIDTTIVQTVIDLLGEVEESSAEPLHEATAEGGYKDEDGYTIGKKKWYRDTDNKMIGGVCSGISAYFGIDVTLIRILAVFSLIFYGVTFFVYVVLWLVIPKTRSILDKMRMYGYAPTADNIRKFKNEHKQR
ncbi:PspC domain-containing protein [Dysgonomonas sp. Marseille-P4361]|uniref:PspC domain-containing protein n=1 Tax=Dysgonomonas sp. Marseille-P4361 TaxID=2161820 RepID=UPI000D55D9D9|nr:PspC domain-containing protein [Dysgonomonas sp. Marseille-P4361]